MRSRPRAREPSRALIIDVEVVALFVPAAPTPTAALRAVLVVEHLAVAIAVALTLAPTRPPAAPLEPARRRRRRTTDRPARRTADRPPRWAHDRPARRTRGPALEPTAARPRLEAAGRTRLALAAALEPTRPLRRTIGRRTAAIARRPRPARLLLGDADADRPTVEHRAVHRLSRRLAVRRVLERDEPEPARAPRLTVGHHLRLEDRPELLKSPSQTLVGRVPAQATDK